MSLFSNQPISKAGSYNKTGKAWRTYLLSIPLMESLAYPALLSRQQLMNLRDSYQYQTERQVNAFFIMLLPLTHHFRPCPWNTQPQKVSVCA